MVVLFVLGVCSGRPEEDYCYGDECDPTHGPDTTPEPGGDMTTVAGDNGHDDDMDVVVAHHHHHVARRVSEKRFVVNLVAFTIYMYLLR